MVPSSVAKTNSDADPPGRAKLLVLLKTCPLGAEGGVPPMGGGMVTTKPCFTPLPLYKVAKPVLLSFTHHGLVEEDESPHGFTTSGSVELASPGMSETKFCWT